MLEPKFLYCCIVDFLNILTKLKKGGKSLFSLWVKASAMSDEYICALK